MAPAESATTMPSPIEAITASSSAARRSRAGNCSTCVQAGVLEGPTGPVAEPAANSTSPGL
jgi:hypothetical protein